MIEHSSGKDALLHPLKKEILSESELHEIENMLSGWSHTKWETVPEVDFLQAIHQPVTVKGIVSLWTHSIPVKDKELSLVLNRFCKLAQPLSIDGKIMTDKTESKAFINVKEGVFLVYQSKDHEEMKSAIFYKNKETKN